MTKVFIYRSNPGIVLEVDGKKAKSVMLEIQKHGVDFGYIFSRHRGSFRFLNPELSGYPIVETVEEFIAGKKLTRFEKITQHVGHKIVCVSDGEEAVVKCEDCNKVIVSANKED